MEIKIFIVLFLFIVDGTYGMSSQKRYDTFFEKLSSFDNNLRRMKRAEINADVKTTITSTSLSTSTSNSSPSSSSISSTKYTLKSVSPTRTSSYLTSSSTRGSTSSSSRGLTSSSSRGSTSSSSGSTSSSSTTTLISKACLAERNIDNFCAIPTVLTGLDIWDIYSEIFSDDVIQSLLINCASGHWCLEDRFSIYAGLVMERAEMVLKSAVFTAACQPSIRSCLGKIVGNLTNCITYRRLNFTLQTIDLLCSLTRSSEIKIDDRCLSHVLVALHVTVVDILRDQNQKSQQLCTTVSIPPPGRPVSIISLNIRTITRKQKDLLHGITDDTCKTPEAQMTRTYLCIETKCPTTDDFISRFRPWQWFMNDVGLISKECNFTRGVCDDDTNFDDKVHKKTFSTVTSSTAATTTSSQLGWQLANLFGHTEETNGLTNNKFKDDEKKTWDETNENINMLIGLFVASIVVLGFMVGVLSVWWKKHRRLRMEKDGYAPLMSDDK